MDLEAVANSAAFDALKRVKRFCSLVKATVV